MPAPSNLRTRTRRSALLMLALLLPATGTLPWSARAEEPEPPAHDLVAVQRGALPVILSAPHGGKLDVPGAVPRKGEGLEKGGRGFFTGRDTGTEELAYALSAAIEQRVGAKPYSVAARFHRKYADANRPAEIGLEGEAAKPVYDAYHGTLTAYAREVRRRWGRGLLLDLHGQGSARDTVFRGTQNGKTVSGLVQRFGEAAHNGPESFFGLMAAQGCRVHPTDGGREQSGFTGGYVVQRYGSHGELGMEAMQLEFGADYRAPERIPETAAKVAAAVQEFARRYLPEKPLE